MFTDDRQADDPDPHPRGTGHLEHIAFTVSRATQTQVAGRLETRSIPFEAHDRGFMDSIYFRDPNGLQAELACYKFQPPRVPARSRCSERPTPSAGSAAPTTSPTRTWPTPSNS